MLYICQPQVFLTKVLPCIRQWAKGHRAAIQKSRVEELHKKIESAREQMAKAREEFDQQMIKLQEDLDKAEADLEKEE